MTVYPIYQAFFLSFFSKNLYRDICNNWKGIGIKYLLSLSFIIAIFISANWFIKINKIDSKLQADLITTDIFGGNNLSFEQNMNRILDITSQIPPLKIEDGHAIIDSNDPIFIIDPVYNNEVIIMDTSGKYHSLEGTNALALLTKNRFYLKTNQGEDVTYLSSLSNNSGIDEGTINNIAHIISQIPKISVIAGRAQTDAQQPYYISNLEGEKVVTIDTTGKTESLDEKESLLITDEKIIIRNPYENEVKEFYIDNINEDSFYLFFKYSIDKMKDISKWAVPFLLVPLMTLSTFAAAFFMAILYSVIGFTMTKIFKIGDFTFEEVSRLCAVASTPVIILNLITPQIFSNQGVIYFLVAIAYVYFALSSNIGETNKHE